MAKSSQRYCQSENSGESAVTLVIRNARIVTLDQANRVLDSGAVEVLANGSIGHVARDAALATKGVRTIDARGKLLFPALINCHTHLYSTLARGIALGGAAPRNFPQILNKLWWKLDSALHEEDIYYSALVGLMDSAKAGVGALVDHHSSPRSCPGSLDVIARAFEQVGVRGALCYETSDRNGAAATDEAIRENVRFIERTRRNQCHIRRNRADVGRPHVGRQSAMIGAAFGLHASFTLSDHTLRRCAEANQAVGGGFHIHVAEDASDVRHAQSRFGKTPVQRLCDLGILNDRAIAAHCVHVSMADVASLAQRGVNVVHNPQSNCNNAVGTANVAQLLRRSVLVGLGSDGFSPRLWDEFVAASHVQKLRTRDPRAGMAEAYIAALLNNRTIAKKIWGWDIGKIERGARADMALLDYYPPTPLYADNLIDHITFGIAHAAVESLIVNGKLVVRDGHCVNLDEREVSEAASARARKLWQRL